MNLAVLFVDHATGLGGAEHSLLLLLQHLDHAEWQPHLACPDGALARQAREQGVPWHSISLPQLRRSRQFAQDWRYFSRDLARIAHENGAVALYANTVRAALYGMWAARIAKRPFLWHMRDFWLSETAPRFRGVDWAAKWVLCRAAAQVIANSAATASHLPCEGKTAVVHNGIDLARFAQALEGHVFRQAYHIPTDAPLVGMVGRLRPWKGQHRFIEMAALVRQSWPEAHFVLVGGVPLGEADSYPAQLRQQAAAHNLADCLHFTGHLSDVRPALAALDIFCASWRPRTVWPGQCRGDGLGQAGGGFWPRGAARDCAAGAHWCAGAARKHRGAGRRGRGAAGRPGGAAPPGPGRAAARQGAVFD